MVEGQLAVAQLHLSLPAGATQAKVTLGDAAVEAVLKVEAGGAMLRFAAPVAIKPGNPLAVVLS